jgi:hypothetical protein
MISLHERDLIALLLVRAVEQHDPSFFTPEVLSESALAAVDASSDAELLEKRTSYLFLRLPKAMRAWARIALLPEDSLGLVILAAFLVGVFSNYLGPSGLVHVAYNPLAFLITWNVGIYAALTWRWLVHARSPQRLSMTPPSGEHTPQWTTAASSTVPAPREECSGSFCLVFGSPGTDGQRKFVARRASSRTLP